MSTETDRAELVERLAMEAGMSNTLLRSGSWVGEKDCVQRFAALVAAECARLAGPEDSWFATKSGAAQRIRERFGIKEGL